MPPSDERKRCHEETQDHSGLPATPPDSDHDEPEEKKPRTDRTDCEATLELWTQETRTRFPNLLTQTRFHPPVYMNNTHQEQKSLAGYIVGIPQPPVETQNRGDPAALQESLVRNDRTHQRILKRLQKVSKKTNEVMFIISQLQFKNYLGDPNYAAEADKFPRPIDLKKENKHRGDFDIVIIHRQYGLIVAEIKAIGDIPGKLDGTDKKKKKISEKVERAIKQLDKEGHVLEHLVSDMQPRKPRVSKVMMLPNVSRQDLKEATRDNQGIVKELHRCLDVPEDVDVTDLIMCDDQLQEKGTAYDIITWWKKMTSNIGKDESMTDGLYEELVARFGGPATVLSVTSDKRESPKKLTTEGDGVSETGSRFMRMRLHPEQEEVLEKPEQRAFLCGPPGTGKTVTLQVRAAKWLREEYKNLPVDIVSTWSGSIAAAHLIKHELTSAGVPERLVRFHHFDLKEEDGVDVAVAELLTFKAADGHLCVIADEAFCGSQFEDFCDRLHNNTNLCLWAASVYHGFQPSCLKLFNFCKPLRTPPAITEKVQKSSLIKDGYVHKYEATLSPPPTEGPSAKKIRHNREKHTQGWPGDCEQCGLELAAILKDLKIGQAVSPGSPPPLCYRDIFLLTSTYELVDEEREADDVITQPASGLLEGLRSQNVPVSVVARGDTKALQIVAEGTGPDAVVAADADSIRGLERKIVIWLPYDVRLDSSGTEMDFARLDALSRATAQLVVID